MKMMNWTHEELKSFPTEDITHSDQISAFEVLRSGGSSMFIFVNKIGKRVDILDGLWSSGKRINPIPEWTTTETFDNVKPSVHGWKKVLIDKEYDPTQQPYDEDDI
jgi:hypothetical protein